MKPILLLILLWSGAAKAQDSTRSEETYIDNTGKYTVVFTSACDTCSKTVRVYRIGRLNMYSIGRDTTTTVDRHPNYWVQKAKLQ